MRKETARTEARTRFVVMTVAGIVTFLYLLPLSSQAGPSDCSQPVISAGSGCVNMTLP